MRKWRSMSLTSKLAVCFIAYVVVGFPAVLFGGGAILEAAGIPATTSAGGSPAVTGHFVILVGPVIVFPVLLLVVGVRNWREAGQNHTPTPYSLSPPLKRGKTLALS